MAALIAWLYVFFCGLILIVWSRLNDFKSIAESIQYFEQSYDHGKLSGNRRGYAKKALLLQVRAWLSHDIKGSIEGSRRPFLVTIAFVLGVFALGVLSILSVDIFQGGIFNWTNTLRNADSILLLAIDELLFDALSQYNIIETADFVRSEEKMILLTYLVTIALIFGRLVGYVFQTLITIGLIYLLPLSVLRKAKEIRSWSNDFGLRSSKQALVDNKGRNALKIRRGLDLVGYLVDFKKNAWEKSIEPTLPFKY